MRKILFFWPFRFMPRGGNMVQEEIHRYLKRGNVSFVKPETVIQVSPGPAKPKELLSIVPAKH
jgi:hypothetical protein